MRARDDDHHRTACDPRRYQTDVNGAHVKRVYPVSRVIRTRERTRARKRYVERCRCCASIGNARSFVYVYTRRRPRVLLARRGGPKEMSRSNRGADEKGILSSGRFVGGGINVQHGICGEIRVCAKRARGESFRTKPWLSRMFTKCNGCSPKPCLRYSGISKFKNLVLCFRDAADP